METLERHQPLDPMSDAPFDPMPPQPRSSRWPSVWRQSCAFLLVAAVAFATGSLVALKDRLAVDWQTALTNFRWIVLVSGDNVEIDEVGRYLKQMDGVASTTLLPPNAIIDQLKTEPLLADQIPLLDQAALPAVWNVGWGAGIDASSMVENLQELKKLPGVVDVAFDGRELRTLVGSRVLWLKVRVIVSALALLGAALFCLLLGRLLFFASSRSLGKAVPAATVTGVLAWAAGLALAWKLVGPFSPLLAWGGAVAILSLISIAPTTRPE